MDLTAHCDDEDEDEDDKVVLKLEWDRLCENTIRENVFTYNLGYIFLI